MSERKDANLSKLALMALRKKGLVFEQLSTEDIQSSGLPAVIINTLLSIKVSKPELTLEKVNEEIHEIMEHVDVTEIDVTAYDPKEEIKQFVAPYVEETEVVTDGNAEVIEHIVVINEMSEADLRAIYELYPECKNANSLLKKVLTHSTDELPINQELAVQLSKEYIVTFKERAKQ